LLNEEFHWDRSSLEGGDVVYDPIDSISPEEVRRAVAAMKNGKAAGLSGVVAEMLKASGEVGINWMTELFNKIIADGRIPDDWKKSLMVTVYKGKGDALECGSYRGIKLLEHAMKVFERVTEKKLRNVVKNVEEQFGFQPGKGTTDAIFIVRQIQERCTGNKEDLWMDFVDLEKAFDRVPREVLWWALRCVGLCEWMINIVMSMYDGVTTAVKVNGSVSNEFDVKVGVHQGSVLSPLLFTIVFNALTRKCRGGLPRELLYADDLVLLVYSETELKEKIRIWKNSLESRGLRVNVAKTKVMKCSGNNVGPVNPSKYLCGVCRKGVGDDSIQRIKCKQWIHKRCSKIKGPLKAIMNFKCARCLMGNVCATTCRTNTEEKLTLE
jgi:hypothetical protein